MSVTEQTNSQQAHKAKGKIMGELDRKRQKVGKTKVLRQGKGVHLASAYELHAEGVMAARSIDKSHPVATNG